MKPFAYVVHEDSGHFTIHFTIEDARQYKEWIGATKPITEVYEHSTWCVKESFDAGYRKAMIDVQQLSIAVDILKDFAKTVGCSSDFWEYDYDEKFDAEVFEIQKKIIRACAGYKEE